MTFNEAVAASDLIDKIVNNAYDNRGGLKLKRKLNKLYKEYDKMLDLYIEAKEKKDKDKEEFYGNKMDKIHKDIEKIELPDPIEAPEEYQKFYNDFLEKKHKILGKIFNKSLERQDKKQKKRLGIK